MKKKYSSLSALLTPDYMFESFDKITPEFLSSLGIRALLIDIDNTLAPYEMPLPDEKIINWFSSLQEKGIKAALISNNKKERVDLFNKSLSLPAYHDAKKPSSKCIIKFLEETGIPFDMAAGIGDQLLTDTLAVHRLGITSIIVPPIKDKKNLFFRFKRMLEKPFIKKYKRMQKI